MCVVDVVDFLAFLLVVAAAVECAVRYTEITVLFELTDDWSISVISWSPLKSPEDSFSVCAGKSLKNTSCYSLI